MKKLSPVAALMILAAAAPGNAQTLVGQPIHNFGLFDLNGTLVSPNDFKERCSESSSWATTEQSVGRRCPSRNKL